MSNRYIQPAFISPIILNTSSGKTIDITSLVKEINVYESLFSHMLTADMTLTDIPSNRLIQHGAIGAKDKITFEFAGKTKDMQAEKSIKIELYIYKIGNSPSVGQLQSCFINLGPEQFFSNNTKEISRHFEGKISTIVKKLTTELNIQDIEIEETIGEYKFLATYKSPFELIHFLTNKAISARNKNDHNYVFYQDSDAKYHFISVGSLMKKQSKFGTNSKTGFVHMMPFDEVSGNLKNIVLGCESSEISPVKNAIGGMYTSQIMTYDITNKTYNMRTFSLDNIYPSQSHLSDKKIIDGNDQEFKKTLNSSYVTRYAQKTEYCYDCEKNKGFQDKIGGHDDITLPRLCSMEQLNQLSLLIKLNGNSVIRAGDVFYFGRPIQQGLSDKPDISYNGKYLATEVCHTIQINVMGQTQLEYKTKVRGIKDSIGDE